MAVADLRLSVRRHGGPGGRLDVVGSRGIHHDGCHRTGERSSRLPRRFCTKARGTDACRLGSEALSPLRISLLTALSVQRQALSAFTLRTENGRQRILRPRRHVWVLSHCRHPRVGPWLHAKTSRRYQCPSELSGSTRVLETWSVSARRWRPFHAADVSTHRATRDSRDTARCLGRAACVKLRRCKGFEGSTPPDHMPEWRSGYAREASRRTASWEKEATNSHVCAFLRVAVGAAGQPSTTLPRAPCVPAADRPSRSVNLRIARTSATRTANGPQEFWSDPDVLSGRGKRIERAFIRAGADVEAAWRVPARGGPFPSSTRDCRRTVRGCLSWASIRLWTLVYPPTNQRHQKFRMNDCNVAEANLLFIFSPGNVTNSSIQLSTNQRLPK